MIGNMRNFLTALQSFNSQPYRAETSAERWM